MKRFSIRMDGPYWLVRDGETVLERCASWLGAIRVLQKMGVL